MSSPLQPLPDIDLRHLQRMTDDTGLFQHAVYATPDANHGYCIDDIARALIAGVIHAQLAGHDEKLVPLHTYLTFLHYAYNEELGKFRNFMGYDRQWLEAQGSHDSQGRTVWALGVTATHGPTRPIRQLAAELYFKALPPLQDLNFPRSWAFSLLGLDAFLKGHPDHAESAALRDTYAQKLFEAYRAHATDDWPWWEDEVTYDNAKLCQALIICGASLDRPEITEAGLTSLSWLLEQQLGALADGTPCLSIIGNDGWLQRGQPRAKFDQQPLEAYAMVDACLQAARVAGDAEQRAAWEGHARLCFEWFTGRNDLNESLYDPETGGGRDGLNADGVNQNQGAESSLAYLIAVLEMHRYVSEA